MKKTCIVLLLAVILMVCALPISAAIEISERTDLGTAMATSDNGFIRYSIKNRICKINDALLDIQYGLVSSGYSQATESFDSYEIKISDNTAEYTVKSCTDGPYGAKEHSFSYENGKAVPKLSDEIKIPYEVFSEGYGMVSIVIYAKPNNNPDGIFETDSNGIAYIASSPTIYYKSDGNTVELSSCAFDFQSKLWLDYEYDSYDGKKKQVEDAKSKYNVKTTDITLCEYPIDHFEIIEDRSCILEEHGTLHLLIGSRINSNKIRISLYDISSENKKAKLNVAFTLNYRGDYSIDFKDTLDFSFNLYLWDDNKALAFGNGASNVISNIDSVASIRDTKENETIRKEINDRTNPEKEHSVMGFTASAQLQKRLFSKEKYRSISLKDATDNTFVVYNGRSTLINKLIDIFRFF